MLSRKGWLSVRRRSSWSWLGKAWYHVLPLLEFNGQVGIGCIWLRDF